MDKTGLVEIREYTPADHNFILATWLRGLRHGNDFFEMIDRKIYFESYHKIIELIIARPSTTVLIACLKDDPEVILGYSVLSQSATVLHWVFCKKAWRNIGIAKNLIPSTVDTVTHFTKVGASILSKHKNIKFNPFTY